MSTHKEAQGTRQAPPGAIGGDDSERSPAPPHPDSALSAHSAVDSPSALALKPQAALVESLRDSLARQLRSFVEGAQDDLRIFAEHLALDIASLPLIVGEEEREAKLARTLDRMRALAESHRIRAEHMAWESASLIIRAAAHTLLAVAMTA